MEPPLASSASTLSSLTSFESIALLTPLALQGAAMLFDEGVHHRKRRLPRWERIGHPLDTLTVAACYAFAAFAAPTRANLYAYVALAAFSCIFVTKDERVHAAHCSAAEHWLHAVLFVLHPIAFGAVGILWWSGERAVAIVQLALTVTFALYQALYWNLRPQRAHAPARVDVTEDGGAHDSAVS